MKYAVAVVSAVVGQVVATATYPQDTHNYFLALTSADGGHVDVYKVLQEFSGWDATQPITFDDATSGTPLVAGTYTLALRERYQVGHSMAWKTHASTTVTVG